MTISARNKILTLILYLLGLALLLTLYHTKRLATTAVKRADLQGIRREITGINNTLAEMNDYRKSFRQDAHLMVFVEALYRTADEHRLVFHEVTSDGSPSSSVQEVKDSLITGSRYRIVIKGEFRSVVEYVRSIMNLQQFCRINELKITTDQKGVTGNIHLEIFTFR